MTGSSELIHANGLANRPIQAHEILESFPRELKVVSLYLALIARRSSFNKLVNDVYLFMKDRYFIGEVLEACLEGKSWYNCTILQVRAPTEQEIKDYRDLAEGPTEDEQIFPPACLYHYQVEKFCSYNDISRVFEAGATQVRRKKRLITKGKLSLFLKQCLILNPTGIWIVQETVQQNLGIQNVKFSDIFVGQPPTFPTKYEKVSKKVKKGPSSILTGQNDSSSIVVKKEGARKIKQAKKPSLDVNCSTSSNEDTNAGDFKCGVGQVADSHSTVCVNKISPRKSPKIEANHPTKVVKRVRKKYGKQESEKQNSENPAKRKYATWRGLTWEERQKNKEKKKKRELLEKLRKREERLKEKQKREEEKRQMAIIQKDRNVVKEDLECEDLKAMPVPQEVKCSLIPNELFGDFVFILEFFHYFQTLVSVSSFFSRGITFRHLESALTDQNIEGPLSNVIMMLLTALFKMQVEENDVLETDTSAIDLDSENVAGSPEVAEAALLAAAECTRRLYHGAFVSEMGLNYLTVTEVLRLHFLSCGGGRGELDSRNRRDLVDPGDPVTMLRIKHPQILRDLSTTHVCEMTMQEKINILICLIDQVLACHAVREELDERGEQLRQWKLEIRAYRAAEVKRKKEAHAQIIKEKREARQKLKDGETSQSPGVAATATAAPKVEIQEKVEAENIVFEKELRSAEKKKMDIQEKVGKLRTLSMNYQMCPLGSDRAHRRFWVFSSLPGLYVENSPYEIGPCLTLRKDSSLHAVKESKSPIRNTSQPRSPMKKEFSPDAHQTSRTIDGGASYTDSWICTSSESCPVHGLSLTRRRWSYFASKEDLTHLIESLNKSGIRESELRKILVREEYWLKEVIDQCPVHLLNSPSTAENKTRNVLPSKYRHLNCPPGASVNMLMELVLRERILHLESRISGRCMGSLDVKDLAVWREAIGKGEYDKQCEQLQWGFCSDETNISESDISDSEETNSTNIANDKVIIVNCNDVVAENITQNSSTSSSVELKISSSAKSRESLPGRVLEEKNGENYRPSSHESETKAQADTKKNEVGVVALAQDNQSKTSIIKNLASAILQLAQSVDERYLKNPLTDEDDEEQKIIQVKRWEVSLMNSTSFSQLLLHITLLESSIHWSKSVLNTRCALCRKRGDGEKMLLCDGCNRGHHLYCLKPKLKNVPHGDWFCLKCQPDQKKDLLDKKRKSMDTESVGREYEKRPSKSRKIVHNDVCEACGLRYNLILCSSCPLAFHPVCVTPPMKEAPEGFWTCHECASQGSSSAAEEKENDTTTSRRSSRRKSGTSDAHLNNSLLQDLLSDIMCQKDAWPFLQPVRKAEAPRYHIIVKKPMDLGTMKYKLNRAQYKNNSEFLADALLIFENCRMYNEDDAEVFKCGSRLSQYFKKRCKDLGLDIRD